MINDDDKRLVASIPDFNTNRTDRGPIIICIVGAQASGKSTLEKWISKEFEIPRLVSHTTRPKRDTDQDDEYNFVTDKEFDELHQTGGGFIEKRSYTVASGEVWKYGLHHNQITEDLHLAVVDYQGFCDLRKEFNVLGIHLMVSPEESIRRVKEHRPNYDLAEAYRRIKHDVEAIVLPASADDLMFQVRSQPHPENTKRIVATIVNLAKGYRLHEGVMGSVSGIDEYDLYLGRLPLRFIETFSVRHKPIEEGGNDGS